jgi:hypothetical protein
VCPCIPMRFSTKSSNSYDVSDRLDSLAEQHPLVTEALLTISESERNTATLLEVLVAMKITPFIRLNAADA